MAFAECLRQISGIYNLVLVAIVMVVFYFFLKRPTKKIYLKPWKVLFFTMWVYIIEEIASVLHQLDIYSIPLIGYPLLEMVIISSAIYMLLLQKQHVKEHLRVKKK